VPVALDQTFFIMAQMAHSIKLTRRLSQASFCLLSIFRSRLVHLEYHYTSASSQWQKLENLRGNFRITAESL
jgi:hypothetical protein